MKKEYTTPTAELEMLDACDVITTSDWTLPEVPIDTEQNGQTNQPKFNW